MNFDKAKQVWRDSRGNRVMAYAAFGGGLFLLLWEILDQHSWLSGLIWFAWMTWLGVAYLMHAAQAKRDWRRQDDQIMFLLEEENRVRGMLIRAEHLMLGDKR